MMQLAFNEAATKILNRQYVLALYKKCLTSVQRIPESDQRHMYRQYVRDRFRQHQTNELSSRQAYIAIRDAEEQLERMNYFHSIREQRILQQQQPQELLTETPTATYSTSTEPSKRWTTSSKSDSHNNEVSNSQALSKDLVQMWILTHLPQLRPDDLQHYSQQLVQLGFDSHDMLEHVALHEDDLSFMKTAHRRALLQRLQRNDETS